MLSKKQLLTLIICSIMHSSLGITSNGQENIADLSERKTIITLIDPSLKSNNPAIRAMHALETQMYESEVRVVKGPDGRGAGQAFCCHPEALAKFIPLIRGKTVLEVASASRENGAFLAFNGAKKVFINELQETEVSNFKTVKANLPSVIQARLQPLWGDIFEILQKNKMF